MIEIRENPISVPADAFKGTALKISTATGSKLEQC